MLSITYSGAHARVRRIKGEASFHQCHCGESAQEWAYVHDSPGHEELTNSDGRKYSGNVDSYTPMCFRCHRIYDKATITRCPQGHEYAGDNLIMDAGKRKCRTCVYQRNNDRRKKFGMTAEQKARKLQLQRERRATARRDTA